jgi:alanine racemase
MKTGQLRIDLGAVRANYTLIQKQLSGKTRAAAVVKANAYGLGAAEIAKALYAEGCRDFFVSSLEEGVNLRKVITDGRIHILNGFYASGEGLYPQHNLIPCLGSFLEIEGYKKLAAKEGRKLPAYISFNTRMNRLGLGTVEADKLLQDMSMLSGLEIVGVLSHFACADDAQSPMNEKQFSVFNDIARYFPGAEKSLCNSSGIFRDQKFHFDLVRPGMALYGLNPTPEKENPMRPVVSLQVPVIRTRIVYKGASVGYGATYKFEKDTPIATVSAGYADGIFWSLGNKGKLYWKGHACPIRGRVSMDLTTVDLSGIPENERPRPGDFLELLGSSQTADAFAADAGTIGYEVLTRLGARYERFYVGG